MIKLKVDANKIRDIVLNKRRLKAASEKLAQLIKAHVVYGQDCNGTPFAPLDYKRLDGSTENPLLATGKHLLKSIHGFTTRYSFGVGTNFIGARIHQYGTVGKGGTMPTIRPKKGRSLRIPVYAGEKNGKPQKDHVYADHADIHPRPFFSISDEEIRDVIRAFNDANK